MSFVFKLEEVLNELDITRNTLSVESKVRPATIQDLYTGSTKRIELGTIEKILDTLNAFAKKKSIEKVYTIDNLIEYTKKDAE